MEVREDFLYDLKRRPAGGRKRPSSAAENEAAGTRIDTPRLACIGLALRAPRRGNLRKTRTGRFRWPVGIAHGPSGVERPQKFARLISSAIA